MLNTNDDNFIDSLNKAASAHGPQLALESLIEASLQVVPEKFPEIIAKTLQDSPDKDHHVYIAILRPFLLKYLDKYPEQKSNLIEKFQEYPALLLVLEEKISTQNPDLSLTFGWQASQKDNQITHHDDGDKSQEHQQKAFTL